MTQTDQKLGFPSPLLGEREMVRAMKLHPLLPWMLVLLPGNALVALDLARGVVRFDVWLVRFLPALAVLAFVGWAVSSRSAMALRLRIQLKLAMLVGVPLLLSSGLSLCNDTYGTQGFWPGLLRLEQLLALVFLPAATLIVPWSLELRGRTWEPLLMQPHGRRVLLEKFMLGAGLVVVSSVQASAGLAHEGELALLPVVLHLVAMALALPLFLLVRNAFLSVMGSALVGMALIGSAIVSSEWAPAEHLGRALVFALGAAALAVLPRALRRLPLTEAELGSTPRAARWVRLSLPWRAELEPQRLLLALPALGVVATLLFSMERGDGAVLPLFICCATTALMSPGIVFSEARRQGTLEPLLAVLPRAVVFRRKLAAAGLFTFVSCVVLPTLTMALVGGGSAQDSVAWVVSMGFLFAVGVVAAHFTAHAAVTLALGGGAALLLAATQVLVTEASVVLLRNEFLEGRLLAASFVGTSLVLLAMAWLTFSGRVRVSRVLPVGAATCLVQALALAVVGSSLPV